MSKRLCIADIAPKINYACFMRLPLSGCEDVKFRIIRQYCFVLTVDGTLIYEELNRAPIILTPGNLLIIYPGLKHKLLKPKGKAFFSSIYHNLTDQYNKTNEVRYQLTPEPDLIYPVAGKNPHLVEQFQRVSYYYYGNTVFRESMMSCIAKEIWLSLFEHQVEKQEIPRRLTAMLDYLTDNFDKNVGRKELSEVFFLSPGHINKMFHNYLGKSPSQYILELKIHKARELLEDTFLTIAEISDKLGFYDSFHFSKIFKKSIGVSPKRYRDGL